MGFRVVAIPTITGLAALELGLALPPSPFALRRTSRGWRGCAAAQGLAASPLAGV
jgi:hypothetical protein